MFMDCEPLRGLRERFFRGGNGSIAAILGDNIDVDSAFQVLEDFAYRHRYLVANSKW